MTQHQEKIIYLDHAATTPLDPGVFERMKPYLTEHFANPSSPYSIAKKQRAAVDEARKKITDALMAPSDSVVFTSSGTESDNLALFGIARRHQSKGKHIITTAVEHEAILKPAQELEREGFEITYLPVNQYGEVDLDDIRKALRLDTILVSIMYANNEIGTIEPIAKIGKIIAAWRAANKTHYPYFHTDACQAAGTLSLNVDELGVDLMTLNGSKIYGPKGIGVLYVRDGIEVTPQIFGGGQEKGLRSGTENVASIVGLAEALTNVQKNRVKDSQNVKELRDYFWKSLQMSLSSVSMNGLDITSDGRLSNNLHVNFKGIESDSLIAYLDKFGIMCAAGSACSTESLEPSHILTACGLSQEQTQSSIRFTLGKDNTKEDIEYTTQKISEAVILMRKL